MSSLPIDDTLSRHTLTAELILLGLTRKGWADQRDALRDYVRWLLAKKDRRDELREFGERLEKSDASLDSQVVAGNLTDEQANQARGGRIWWRSV